MTFHSGPPPFGSGTSLSKAIIGVAGLVCAALATLSPPPCQATPIVITSVSDISTQQDQTIALAGSGFGTLGPYIGNSGDIAFFDLDHNAPDGWSAGFAGLFPGGLLPGVPSPVFVNDAVTLVVTSWTDSRIVLGGFSGAWGANGWLLNNADDIEIFVWNAQSGNGPAYIKTQVGQPVANSPEPGSAALMLLVVALLAALRPKQPLRSH